MPSRNTPSHAFPNVILAKPGSSLSFSAKPKVRNCASISTQLPTRRYLADCSSYVVDAKPFCEAVLVLNTGRSTWGTVLPAAMTMISPTSAHQGLRLVFERLTTSGASGAGHGSSWEGERL